ncbi:AraC family transcriptional regulator [[Mannheimia] succiniciproducens]|nr:AraC family transcriptional regulator [[Mannheimia] succiniciproducens]
MGYESPNQFSREFKRYFGMTPKQNKEQNFCYFNILGSVYLL